MSIQTASIELLQALAQVLRNVGHEARVTGSRRTGLTLSTSADAATVSRVWKLLAAEVTR